MTQRGETSSSYRTRRDPQAGHSLGNRKGWLSFGRSSITTRTTFGITSPPFSITTRSSTRMSLRSISSALCRVARCTVEPATVTGSRTATGEIVPVRPTCRRISRSLERTCWAANLKAMALRGLLLVLPSRSC